MSSYTQDYGDSPGDSSAWDRIEATRRAAAARVILVTMGDALLDIARIYGRLGCRYTPKACGACVNACNAYQLAGMTRAGQIAWRWARLLHRRRWRQEGRS